MAETGTREWADRPENWRAVLAFLATAEERKGPRHGAFLADERLFLGAIARAMLGMKSTPVDRPKRTAPKSGAKFIRRGLRKRKAV